MDPSNNTPSDKQINETIRSAIDSLGEKETFQFRLTIFVMVTAVISTFSTLGPPFLFMNPRFSCPGVEQPSEAYACEHLESCTLENGYTITGEVELYCGGRRDDRNVVQSVMGVGAMIGVVFVNALGTFLGKLVAFRIGIALASIQGFLFVAGTYGKKVWMLAAANCLGGASHMAMIVLVILLLQRYGTTFVKPRVSAFFGVCNTGLAVAILSIASPHW